VEEPIPSRARSRTFAAPWLGEAELLGEGEAGAARSVQDGAALRISRTAPPLRGQPFRPLPRPTGLPPFRLPLESVLPPERLRAIRAAGKLVCHLNGDTGGVKDPHPQLAVAALMERDFRSAPADRPAFLYLLGDLVYFFGEAGEYYPQFYEPYVTYPAPIFAVPGNHDGDLRDGTGSSLAAFVENFCAPVPQHTAAAADAPRDAMTQPHVYWTLDAPFVTVVGLYTNVPEGGQLDESQIGWLHGELTSAPEDKALLVAMHHPIYSGDDHHSGSAYMGVLLDEAVQQTGRIPDGVLAGHVHNYQRYTRTIQGRAVPYLVAGAGGYHNLHRMQRPGGASVQPPLSLTGQELTLDAYCDDRHGYLRLELSPDTMRGAYFALPRPGARPGAAPRPIDAFALDLKTHRLERR
jgi:acid phosphatase type 7